MRHHPNSDVTVIGLIRLISTLPVVFRNVLITVSWAIGVRQITVFEIVKGDYERTIESDVQNGAILKSGKISCKAVTALLYKLDDGAEPDTWHSVTPPY